MDGTMHVTKQVPGANFNIGLVHQGLCDASKPNDMSESEMIAEIRLVTTRRAGRATASGDCRVAALLATTSVFWDVIASP
jgi:hypothetical protein